MYADCLSAIGCQIYCYYSENVEKCVVAVAAVVEGCFVLTSHDCLIDVFFDVDRFGPCF